MKISAKTDVGIVREMNQDSLAYGMLSNNSCYAVVCDGMGGAAGGNIASAKACEVISECIKDSFKDKFSFELDGKKCLSNAVKKANKEVLAESKNDEDLYGMGTTAVVVLCDTEEKKAVVANVGDSRIYKLSEGQLSQLTHDHSYVQILIDSGVISEEDALNHPRRNMITRCVGTNSDIIVDCEILPFEENEVLLLCSDGLTNYVNKEAILQELLAEDFESCAERLIDLANLNGGGDNITVLAVKF